MNNSPERDPFESSDSDKYDKSDESPEFTIGSYDSDDNIEVYNSDLINNILVISDNINKLLSEVVTAIPFTYEPFRSRNVLVESMTLSELEQEYNRVSEKLKNLEAYLIANPEILKVPIIQPPFFLDSINGITSEYNELIYYLQYLKGDWRCIFKKPSTYIDPEEMLTRLSPPQVEQIILEKLKKINEYKDCIDYYENKSFCTLL